MKIQQKLILGFLGTSLLVGITGYISIITNLIIKNDITQLSESTVFEVEAATEMGFALQSIKTSVQDLIAQKYRGILESEYAPKAEVGIRKEQEKIRNNTKKIETYLALAYQATEVVAQAVSNNESENSISEKVELKTLNKIKANFASYKKLVAQYLFITKTKPYQAEEFLNAVLEPYINTNLLPLIREYQEDAELELQLEAIEIEKSITNNNRTIILSTGFIFIIAIFLGFSISNSILNPIIKLKNAVVKIGKGELNTRADINSQDEVGILANTFNCMMDNLSVITVSKSYMDNIVNSMLNPLFVTDVELVITKINEAVIKLLQYEEKELVGKHIKVVFAEGKLPKNLKISNLSEDLTSNIETTYLTKGGNQIPVSFSASLMRDQHNKIQGIVCVAQDITDRKQAEEANSRLATAVEYAADAIEITDTQARFQYVNPAFEKITGYTPTEVLGKTSAALLRSGKHDTAFYQDISNTISSGQVWSGTYTGKRKDGSFYYQEATISPVCNSAGEIIHHVAVKRDITERKRLEERLTKINQCFLSFGTDSLENINRLTAVCGELLEATSMLYSRLDEGMLCVVAKWQVPEGYSAVDHPDTHICYEVIKRGGNEACVITNLPDTSYAQTDFNVMFYGWKNYIGQPVKCKDKFIGSLCAVYQNDFIPTDADKTVIGIIAAAIGVEEERRRTQEDLEENKERYRAVVEQASEGIFLVDVDTKLLLEANAAFQNLLNYTLAEILKLKIYDFSAYDRQSIDFNIQHILTQKSQSISEQQYRRQDNSLVDVEVNTNLISYEGREVLCVIVRDITERKVNENQLRHNAFHDALTGLANRVLFMERLEYAIARVKRRDYLFAVLFLDLDRFKVINDSLGHLIGDQLLIAIARRLETCLRPGDTLARLGGDEFTILLENIHDVEDAIQVAERIQKELKLPFNLNGREIFTAASIGIALSTVDHDNSEDFLRDADVTMYRAKSLGRGRFEVFDSTLHTEAMALLQLETDLRRAVERQEFQLYYQPIVSLQTGELSSFEALVRWQHPQRGFISPAEFIPIAEETGVIIPIGWWVLREACCQTSAWHLQFPAHPLTISVNISTKQFSQPDLIKQIKQILQETNLDPRYLKLEITESVLVENAESVAAVLLELQALGIRLSIDDFGTGYSSLSYLHRLPIDTLKLDRSFVNNVDTDTEKIEIARTVVSLAWNLGMDVVAEGVETKKQMYQLKALRCQYGQGYFFSKPLMSDEAEALMAAESLVIAN